LPGTGLPRTDTSRLRSVALREHLPSFTCVVLQEFGKVARQIVRASEGSNSQHQFSQMGSLRVHKRFAEQAVLSVGFHLVSELGRVGHQSLHVFYDEDAAVEGVVLLREER